MLFIGDAFQIPPVVEKKDSALLYRFYESEHFFNSRVLRANPPLYLELKKIYRQKDRAFIDLLNRVRVNEMRSEDYLTLNSRYDPRFRPSEKEHYIMLATILVEHDEQAVTTLGVVAIAIATCIQPHDLALNTHIASLCPDGVLTGGVVFIGHVGDLQFPLSEIVHILCFVACAEGYGHHQKGYASIGPFRKSCHDK